MIKPTRLGNAAFTTPDVERMVAYYEEIVGLVPTAREADGTTYLSTGDDLHCIVLRKGETAELERVALALPPGVSAGDAAGALRAAGVEPQTASDPEPGVSACVDFADADGQLVRLLVDPQPQPVARSGRGYAPEKLGHLARRVVDVNGAVEFYECVLGFKVADWIGDFFVFMRCGPEHHVLNFVGSQERRGIHHLAFQLSDFSHMAAACDLLARHDVRLIWGPGRHGAGHNVFVYYRDPDGHITELFFQLDVVLDEELGYFDPRPWHEQFPQRPQVWEPGLGANVWGPGPPPEMHQ
jgi:catechol 2,3-dioxygenase-like lactoylglutathione lyase family enzyme